MVKGVIRRTHFAVVAVKSPSTSKRRFVLLVDSLVHVCEDMDGVSRPRGAVQLALVV